MASILSLLLQVVVVRASTRINAANTNITTFIDFTSLRFYTVTFTSTTSTAIMISVLIIAVAITVAVTTTLTSIIVLIHILVISTIAAIIVTFTINCTMNVTVITARNNAGIPYRHQYFCYHCCH